MVSQNVLLDELSNKFSDLPQDWVAVIVSLAKNQESRRFLVDFERRTQFLIDCMIGGAREDDEIRIYSTALESNHYLDALNTTRSKRVRILVEDLSAAKQTVNSLASSQQDKITLYATASEKISRFITVGPGFMFCDFKEKFPVASFNEPQSAKIINEHFDSMWKAAAKKAELHDGAQKTQHQDNLRLEL